MNLRESQIYRHLRLHRFEQGVMEERNQRDKEVQEKKVRNHRIDGLLAMVKTSRNYGKNYGKTGNRKEIRRKSDGEIAGEPWGQTRSIGAFFLNRKCWC